jgi:PAS domain S-box-containing protein
MNNEKYKVLMIEDDKLDQIAFQQLVEAEELQYDYTIASSAAEARNILTCQQFDIIISDYLLGDGTAFDVLDVVKDTPTIVVTGTGNEEIAVNAWRSGAYDYLTKDIERSYLKVLPITVENAIRHKKAEDNLHLLSGAIMSTVDNVYITDMDDKITFVNKAFCGTYGYKRDEILGKKSSVLWLAGLNTANTRSVFRTQSIGDACEIGFYHKRKDGSIFPVSFSKSIIKDHNGTKIAIVGTTRDITERVLVEDELRRANLKLKKQCQLKNELLIKVSETLKGLLSDENILDGGAQQKEFWKNFTVAKRIISDLLDIAHIEAGKIKLQQVELNLGDVVSEIMVDVAPLAEQKGVTLKSDIPDDELVINGDHSRIKQALTDLINNSIDMTVGKGHVEACLKDTGSEIIVVIKDDGPAIESSRMDKIFNCFEWFEEQPCWNPEQDRTLSLWIAKKIIEMHGGWIWIESADDRGNNFCIRLPKNCVRKNFSTATKRVEVNSEVGPGD